jgi:hypothetical protein
VRALEGTKAEPTLPPQNRLVTSSAGTHRLTFGTSSHPATVGQPQRQMLMASKAVIWYVCTLLGSYNGPRWRVADITEACHVNVKLCRMLHYLLLSQYWFCKAGCHWTCRHNSINDLNELLVGQIMMINQKQARCICHFLSEINAHTGYPSQSHLHVDAFVLSTAQPLHRPEDINNKSHSPRYKPNKHK